MSRDYDVHSHPRLIEQRAQRKKAFKRRFIIFSIFFITLIFGLAYFSAYHTVVIQQISVEGSKITSSSKIQSIAEDTIRGRYLYLFKRSNIFIYPKSEIIKNIKEELPRINDIDISTNSLTHISIKVKEREGAYLWCGEAMDEENIDQDCYFINLDGYIFDKAPFFSSNIYFKFYAPLNDPESGPLSNTSLSPDKIKDIILFSDALESMSFEPAIIDLSDPLSQKLYLKRLSIKLPKMIFKDENDLEEILNNLATSMKQEEFVHEVKDRYDDLDYIDLRYKNKVVYKHYE